MYLLSGDAGWLTHDLAYGCMQDWAVLRGRGRSTTRIVIHVAAQSADLMPTAVALNNGLCRVFTP